MINQEILKEAGWLLGKVVTDNNSVEERVNYFFFKKDVRDVELKLYKGWRENIQIYIKTTSIQDDCISEKKTMLFRGKVETLSEVEAITNCCLRDFKKINLDS